MKDLRKAVLLALVLALLCGCGAVRIPAPTAEPSAAQPSALPPTDIPADLATPVRAQPSPVTPESGATPCDTPAGGEMPSAAPDAGKATPDELPDLRITIVYDNTTNDPNLSADWGFAAWIEYGDHTLLFDTGRDGPTLLNSMAQLGLDPQAIEVVILSHVHGDHTGGLRALLDTGVRPTVYAPAAFPELIKKDLSARTDLVEVREPVEILSGVHSTGEVGDLPEQSLVIETSDGTVVVTGCAHPGILRIIGEAQSLVEDEVALVLGGFHLVETSEKRIEDIVSAFRREGVRQVSPTHCTGETAIGMFAQEYGDDYVEAGAGRVIAVGAAPVTPEAQAPSTPPALSSVADIVASLEDLSLDEFFEESYKQLLLRDPEHLTGIGLSEAFGLRNDRLTDRSDAFTNETQQLESAILDLLRTHDRGQLTPEQRVSYDVYEWYLDNQVQGHRFSYHDYPLHHFLRSYQFELDSLFTEIQPLDSKQDVEDYVARLSQVNAQTEQVLEGLRIREEMGVVPPGFIVDLAKSDIVRYLGIRSPDPSAIKPQQLRVYTRFSDDLEEVDGLSADEKEHFRKAAIEEIEESFIPAYLKLIDYLEHLRPLASDDAGVWKLPDGDAYYAYMLRQETSTDLTPAEIHEIGLAEVDRIHEEMRGIFAELGYPEDTSFRESMDRAVSDGGLYNISTQHGKDQYVADIEALIEEADQRVAAVFDLRPKGSVIVIGGPTGGYYVSGTPDGSRPGSYHVSLAGQWRPRYSMPTIAYHEAIPGHHFQIAIAQEMNLPLFRNDLVFNAYAEGWAMYGERLAWELGLYDDDPYGNTGRLQYELLRAVRLVTDTGIHAMGWTREQAQVYMDEAMGTPPGRFSHEVDRYIVLPAQATGYKIGMIKLLELRQRTMDQLGGKFDIKEFHNVVLGSGSMPLDILERVVDDYIEARRK